MGVFQTGDGNSMERLNHWVKLYKYCLLNILGLHIAGSSWQLHSVFRFLYSILELVLRKTHVLLIPQ